VQVFEDAPAIGGGQAIDYPVTTTATSRALIAASTAGDPLAQIGIEIYNPAGLLVATSAPTPGVAVAPVLLPVAGNYRVRIRNFGLLPITQTPKLIVREPWEPWLLRLRRTPARERGLPRNFPPPSRAQFLRPGAPTLQSAEPAKCHRMWIFSSSSHAVRGARRLPCSFSNEINEFAVYGCARSAPADA
jgi:hypothetical protein